MSCTKCNAPLDGHEAFCPSCGAFISMEEPTQPTDPSKSSLPVDVVPSEIKKWNWGAFTFNAFWGIGNYSYLPLLCFIPIFNLVWMFVCGFKGNEWAWKSGKFSNAEDFLATQATWNRAGLVSFIIGLVIFVLYGILFAFTLAGNLSNFFY